MRAARTTSTGGETIVCSRNHGREYRREHDKVAALEAAIAGRTPGEEMRTPLFVRQDPKG